MGRNDAFLPTGCDMDKRTVIYYSDELNLFEDKTVFEVFAENKDAYDYLGQPEQYQELINKIFY